MDRIVQHSFAVRKFHAARQPARVVNLIEVKRVVASIRVANLLRLGETQLHEKLAALAWVALIKLSLRYSMLPTTSLGLFMTANIIYNQQIAGS